MANPKSKTPTTSLRFDPEIRRALTAEAAEQGRSFSNLIHWILREYCLREGLIERTPIEAEAKEKPKI